MSKLKIKAGKKAASEGNWEDILERLADQFVKDNRDVEGTTETWKYELAKARQDLITKAFDLVNKIQDKLHGGEYA
jgi:hypothetical protein